MPRSRHNKGGALISALFITAIAAIIATGLIMQQRLLIHEAELIIHSDHMYSQMEGMQYQVETPILLYASHLNAQNANAEFIPLTTQLPKVVVGNIAMTGTIENEQGKFNINNLIYTVNQSQFVSLLRAVVSGLSLQQAYAIAKNITTWMNGNQDDPYYLKQDPAYVASQTEMASISELLLVHGVTPSIYRAIKPYITAIPLKKQIVVSAIQSTTSVATTTAPAVTPASQIANTSLPLQQAAMETPIDINAATAPVLLTTDATLTLPKAEDIIACRDRYRGFATTNAFITACVVPEGAGTLSNITVVSYYYLSTIQGEYNHHLVTLTRLWVTTIQKNNTLKVKPIWQSLE